MATGKIKRIDHEKNYGFIEPDEQERFRRPDGRPADIHFSPRVVQGPRRFLQLSAGEAVEFEAAESERGWSATRVSALGTPNPMPSGTTPRPHREERQDSPRPARPDPTPRRTTQRGYRFLNPYNFVRPLPERARAATAEPTGSLAAALQRAGMTSSLAEETPAVRLLSRSTPPPHDRQVGMNGRILCTVEAVTPLFISDSEEVQVEGEHKSYRFFHYDGQPALPASSLRGMVRSVFEAVTYSCWGVFDGPRLSYHLPPGEALHLVPARAEWVHGQWHLRLLTGTTRLAIGRRPDGPQYAAWIRRYDPMRSSQSLSTPSPYRSRPVIDPLPSGLAHGSRCAALLEQVQHPRRNFLFWSVKTLATDRASLPAPGSGERIEEGWLCLTNQNIENKHDERFFFRATSNTVGPLTVSLTDPVRASYADLIRDYQERHREEVRRRRAQGHPPEQPLDDEPAFSRFILEAQTELREGDLVYAMLEGNAQQTTVQFIVPVSVPRVSFEQRVSDLLPEHLRACSDAARLCPACRVFGWVYSPEPGEQIPPDRITAYAGRVRFTHGRLVHSAGTLEPTPLAILSTPKPTTVLFYLLGRDDRGSVLQQWSDTDILQGYDGDGKELRGRKFYRHHGQAVAQEYRRAGDRTDSQNRTVCDALQPGAKFDFEVEFENLAPVELGVLLWSLTLEEGWHHRLGFARPLGFGSVIVRFKSVTVLSPGERYTTLMADGWHDVPPERRQQWVEGFKAAMAQRYGAAFHELPNVQDLQALLTAPPNGLPVHYPRPSRAPDEEGKNYLWFMGNKQETRRDGSGGPHHALPPAAEEMEGLPLLDKNGRELT